jgi:hypothetical protein
LTIKKRVELLQLTKGLKIDIIVLAIELIGLVLAELSFNYFTQWNPTWSVLFFIVIIAGMVVVFFGERIRRNEKKTQAKPIS